MTNQRFTETLSTGIVTDNVTGKEYKCEMRIDDDLLKLLNELHDEKQSVIDWIDNKIEEIKPYNSALCRATLLELKELLE